MITAEHVTKRFGAQAVLHDLTMQVSEGEIAGLLGPNGSGKTTTVRLISGVIAADSGSLAVDGQDPSGEGDAIRQISGVVTESAGFYQHLSAIENLRFYGQFYGLIGDARADELLAEFGLDAHRDRKVGTFSTGMKKRLGLARALLHRPKLLLLDEPTNGLDPEGIQQVLGEIARLSRQEGITIVICSHLLDQLEPICNRYVFLDGGRVLDQGTPAELFTRYLPEVVMEVETDLVLGAGEFRGLPASEVGRGRLQFTLPDRRSIPQLIQHICAEASIYSVTQVHTGLQALYFKVKEVAAHG